MWFFFFFSFFIFCFLLFFFGFFIYFFFFQAEDGIRDAQESRGLGDVYKRQEEIGLFSWRISNRTIRANKRRKDRFTEVVRDVFGKRPERFVSRKTKEVSALSFDESPLCSSKSIPATISSRMKISKSDRRKRIFPLPIRTVSSLDGQRTSTIEPWIMRRERFSRRRNKPTHPINDYSSHLIGRS